LKVTVVAIDAFQVVWGERESIIANAFAIMLDTLPGPRLSSVAIKEKSLTRSVAG
jgi:hypothetical protein